MVRLLLNDSIIYIRGYFTKTKNIPSTYVLIDKLHLQQLIHILEQHVHLQRQTGGGELIYRGARNIVEQEHFTNLNHKKVEVRQWYRTGLKFTKNFLKKLVFEKNLKLLLFYRLSHSFKFPPLFYESQYSKFKPQFMNYQIFMQTFVNF